MIKVDDLAGVSKCLCGVCDSLDDKHTRNNCPSCHQEVVGFKDKKSEREFRISGLCQTCQDKTFNKKKALFTKKLATILLVQTKLLPPSALGIKDLKDKI